MAKQIIFRSLLLWYIILMISMANSVFCDNTPNDVTSTAESKDNLDISKMIKKYFDGSIDESELINFIKNNKDNFALNPKKVNSNLDLTLCFGIPTDFESLLNVNVVTSGDS